jgi:hypothetical protein
MVHIDAEGHLYHRFLNGSQKIKFLPFTNANRNVFKKHLESLVENNYLRKKDEGKGHGMLRKSEESFC